MSRVTHILAFLVLGLSCSSRHAIPEAVRDFSSDYPKNYLIVHEGSPNDFTTARCFAFSVVEDLSSAGAQRRLTAMFIERLPQLPPCKDEWPRLVIDYRAGRGVSLHSGVAPTAPYSGFAFVALQKSVASDSSSLRADALAEWQYWRGGSSNLLMEQFVFDLTNLYINHIDKPIPQPSHLPR